MKPSLLLSCALASVVAAGLFAVWYFTKPTESFILKKLPRSATDVQVVEHQGDGAYSLHIRATISQNDFLKLMNDIGLTRNLENKNPLLPIGEWPWADAIADEPSWWDPEKFERDTDYRGEQDGRRICAKRERGKLYLMAYYIAP